jgi:transcriptional regulator with XRE-family HTH domain
MSITQKLKRIKKLSNLSQEKLARRLDVSFPTFNSWINGKSIPHKSKQSKINELYQDTIDREIMSESIPLPVKKIFKKEPGLIWWTKNTSKIPLALAVESILKYGEWDQVKTLIKSVGMLKIKRVFQKQLAGRNDYEPETKHFFTLYFNKHARPHSG